MKTLLASLLFFTIAAAPAAADAQPSQQISAAARAAWGFDASDLTPHPGAQFGVLPNGMRYAIMRSADPANSLSVRLRFDAGARDEGEHEQGYFHLLEHLIFHGSRRIPNGALPLMMAHRGMKRLTDFGAVTSYDETVYRLDLAKSDHNARSAALMLMRDVATGLLFTRPAVEGAKKDVRDEIDARDALRDRIAAAQNAFFFPGTGLARGPVAGTKASVGRASPAALKRLYELHYVPRGATLVVVGDFDPAVAEAEIASHFSDWKSVTNSSSKPRKPNRTIAPAPRGSEAKIFVDRAASTSISIASPISSANQSDRAPARDAQFLERLANEMLNRRLAKAGAEADAPFATASAAVFNHFSTARIAGLDIEAKGRDWRGALAVGAVQLHRALQDGFVQSELDEQLAVTRNALAQARSPRSSPALADAIIDAVGRGLVFTEPADPSATFSYLGKVQLADVNAAFRQAWSAPTRLIFVTHDRPLPGGEDAIVQAWNANLGSATAAATN